MYSSLHCFNNEPRDACIWHRECVQDLNLEQVSQNKGPNMNLMNYSL